MEVIALINVPLVPSLKPQLALMLKQKLKLNSQSVLIVLKLDVVLANLKEMIMFVYLVLKVYYCKVLNVLKNVRLVTMIMKVDVLNVVKYV